MSYRSLDVHIAPPSIVMPGLGPGIHACAARFGRRADVDGRAKPGHDGVRGVVHRSAISMGRTA